MIAHRPEKRREINCVRAEPRDIAEIFRNAPQIAPRVTFRSGNGTPLQIDISVVLIEIPARETVDEDLIKTRAFHPLHLSVNVGGVDIRKLECVVEIEVIIVFFRQSVLGKITDPVPLFQLEHVHEADVRKRQFRGKIVVQPIGVRQPHARALPLFVKIVFTAVNDVDLQCVRLGSAQAQRDRIFRNRITIFGFRFVVQGLL